DFGDIVLRDDDGSMLRLKNSSIEMVPAPGIENVYGKISSFNIGGRLWIQLDPPQSEELQDNKVVVEGASVGTDGAVWVAGAGYVEVRSSQGNVALKSENGRIYAQTGGGTQFEIRNNRDIMLWGRELWTLGTGNVIHSNSADILFQPSGNIQFGATGGNVFHKYSYATSSPNAVVGPDGRLYRASASSRRAQCGIRPLEQDPQGVAKIQPAAGQDGGEDAPAEE